MTIIAFPYGGGGTAGSVFSNGIANATNYSAAARNLSFLNTHIPGINSGGLTTNPMLNASFQQVDAFQGLLGGNINTFDGLMGKSTVGSNHGSLLAFNNLGAVQGGRALRQVHVDPQMAWYNNTIAPGLRASYMTAQQALAGLSQV